MISFEPTLIVTRMVVDRGELPVYDELFHQGVNVLRGENSSGKSTVLNFIFYGLGGDLAEWSEVALLCTSVTLEVELSGHKATLRREIAEQSGQPMEIFGGAYEQAVASPRDRWMRYPYRRSQTMESFSQALFRLLGFPEVASEDSGNLTIHQVLRPLYADQLSPVESILRFERFDPPALRDAVGRLLCGAYDGTIYENELAIRSLSRDFDAVSGELRSLFAVLGKTDQAADYEWVAERRRFLEAEQQRLSSEVDAAEAKLFEARGSDELSRTAQKAAYERARLLQAKLSSKERERDALSLAIADSASFIAGLKAKLSAIDDASLVAEHLGDVRFSTCPACYAPVDEEPASEHACHLCKTPFDTERLRGRIVAMVNEAAVQLKQSEILQSRRTQRLVATADELAALSEAWDRASRELTSLDRTPSSEAQAELRALNRRAGYLDKEVENLSGQERIVEMIRALTEQKEVLNHQITRLRGSIEQSKALQERRLQIAYTAIADQVRDLLRHDLRRQDSFESPEVIEFDFASNRVSVDGHTYFSASSRVVLKSSFFLGFFAAATMQPTFRHPRFVMIDTIEDKGMEVERSHNFQNQILRKSREAKATHQVIFATAMISPDLDEPEYTVGRFSTRDDPTIAIRA